MLNKGDEAPDFALRGYQGGKFDTYRLSDVLEDGKSVLLTFYYADFSPVCSTQMCDYQDANWFQYKTNLEIWGISRDGPFSHKKFAEDNDLGYPLLSDVEGEACAAYDALETDATVEDLPRQEMDVNGIPGMPQRSVYLVSADGIINYAWQADDNFESPEINHIQQAIKSM
ncbi:MAG: redoxin domain-containing protein [Natronomonas sp.]